MLMVVARTGGVLGKKVAMASMPAKHREGFAKCVDEVEEIAAQLPDADAFLPDALLWFESPKNHGVCGVYKTTRLAHYLWFGKQFVRELWDVVLGGKLG